MKNYVSPCSKPCYSDEFFNELIAKLNAEGFLVVLNHPAGSLQNFKDYGNFIRIEVIDNKCKRAYTRCYYLDELAELN